MHFRIDIFGYRKINELYEEGQRKEAKIREMLTAERAQDRQLKGLVKEMAKQYKELKQLKAKAQALAEERDEWIQKYKASEEARKSLGEKLEKALGAIELLRGGPSMTDPSASLRSAQDDRTGNNPSVAFGDTSPCTGEARVVEGKVNCREAAREAGLGHTGPYGEAEIEGQMEMEE